jgi:hypothetical protein
MNYAEVRQLWTVMKIKYEFRYSRMNFVQRHIFYKSWTSEIGHVYDFFLRQGCTQTDNTSCRPLYRDCRRINPAYHRTTICKGQHPLGMERNNNKGKTLQEKEQTDCTLLKPTPLCFLNTYHTFFYFNSLH